MFIKTINTFLPYPSFTASARCLDRQRLGKQRVEVLQMLKALNGETKAWANHPCTKMWKGYERWLIRYGQAVCLEWQRRGYRDTCFRKISAYAKCFKDTEITPPFIGNQAFHDSHKAALLYKDPTHYNQFGWKVKPQIKYLWKI